MTLSLPLYKASDYKKKGSRYSDDVIWWWEVNRKTAAWQMSVQAICTRYRSNRLTGGYVCPANFRSGF